MSQLGISPVKPPKDKKFPIPLQHSTNQRKPRTTPIGENLQHARWANEPGRTPALQKKDEEIQKAILETQKGRKEKARLKVEHDKALREKERKKQEKQDRLKHITKHLQDQNATKSNPATLKQIKKFLKKSKSLNKAQLEQITDENVVEKWEQHTS